MSWKDINPEDIDRFKLNLISLGSVCGMGVGLLVSRLINSTGFVIVIASLLLAWGLYGIFKSIPLMVYK